MSDLILSVAIGALKNADIVQQESRILGPYSFLLWGMSDDRTVIFKRLYRMVDGIPMPYNLLACRIDERRLPQILAEFANGVFQFNPQEKSDVSDVNRVVAAAAVSPQPRQDVGFGQRTGTD